MGGVEEGERKGNNGGSKVVVLLPATYPKFNPTFKGARYPQPLYSLAVEESQGRGKQYVGADWLVVSERARAKPNAARSGHVKVRQVKTLEKKQYVIEDMRYEQCRPRCYKCRTNNEQSRTHAVARKRGLVIFIIGFVLCREGPRHAQTETPP